MTHVPPPSFHAHLVRLLAALALPACGGIAVLPDGGTGGGAGAGGSGAGGSSTGGAGGLGTGGGGGIINTCNDPPPPPMGYQGFTFCYANVACVATPEVEALITTDLIAQQDPSNCEPCGCYVYELNVQEVCPTSGACCFSGYAGVEGGGCIGRPFFVEHAPRLAPLDARSDWSRSFEAPEPQSAAELTAEQRATLARAWADDARFEHGSIASFARHVLELLALGAPAELVEGAQRAMADEIEHARLCFGLAARYGQPVGPGPLDVSGSLPNTVRLAEAAESAVREGCVTETLSALLAARARDLATEPEVKAALARIAEDEWRHAELAWRFVRWALASGGEEVRVAVRRGFAEASFSPVGGVEGLAAHGRLSANEMAAVAARAQQEVVAPCVRALFGALSTLRELAA